MSTATAAAAALASNSESLYTEHVNPQWVRLLEVLGMKVRYERCEGVELHTTGGRAILDFLSGYCVHNAGYNHPAIVAAIRAELDRRGPGMLQSHVPELAGELASALCERAGGHLSKVFFASSGSEAVEAAIKFSRAHTKRSGLLSASGAFHGLTLGSLSLMDDPFWRGNFGPFLENCETVPFADLAALEQRLATRRFAAFVVEPLQAEAGIRVPPPGYLRAAHELCRKYGTVFVLDEVQTGMYRTGPFLAAHHDHASADIVVLAKALSGGLVPVSATVMTEEIYRAVFGSLKRSIVHASTFSENPLSMRAGLATLETLEVEELGPRAAERGEYLRKRLAESLSGYEMIKEIRGLGLLNGIEFQPPKKVALRLPFQTFHSIHPAMFGQVIVMRLFRDHGILAQICGNHFHTLKCAPPLIITEEQLDRFVSALTTIVDLMHTSPLFWTEALGMARRVVNI